MADDNSLALMLGRMEGKLDMIIGNQNQLSDRVDGLDERMRTVEIQAAKSGAISGGIAAVGTAIAVEILKRSVLHLG
ncbi:MAG: hypothetical protein NT086_01990 [Proteobacteria bacterium]|nr:hypothetical protein [Pseudomonadota bacterium]